jgi:hypothetical protein
MEDQLLPCTGISKSDLAHFRPLPEKLDNLSKKGAEN